MYQVPAEVVVSAPRTLVRHGGEKGVDLVAGPHRPGAACEGYHLDLAGGGHFAEHPDDFNSVRWREGGEAAFQLRFPAHSAAVARG